MVRQGADINTRDTGGNTPLMVAVSEGMDDSAAALIAEGADQSIRNRKGLTAADIRARRVAHPKAPPAAAGSPTH